MPPTTRAAAARMLTGERKPKRQKTSKLPAAIEKAAGDLTTQNALQSPLLRLPAELRTKIWKMAFSGMAIYVSTLWHLEGSKPAARLRYVLSESIDDEKNVPKRSYGPQPVCKQYWFETSNVFLSSCTFKLGLGDVDQFALSGHQVVSRVRKIRLEVSGSPPVRSYEGVQACSVAAVGEFSSLEGIHFVVDHFPHISRLPWGTDITIWYKTGMLAAIRAFQQHPLKEALTEVTCKKETTRFAQEACAIVRSHLLEYRQQRMTRRIRKPENA